VFAEFQRLINTDLDAFRFVAGDLEGAQGLVETSAGYFEDEAARHKATAPYFKHFLGDAAGNSVTLYSDREKYQPDGIRTTARQTGTAPYFKHFLGDAAGNSVTLYSDWEKISTRWHSDDRVGEPASTLRPRSRRCGNPVQSAAKWDW
jgi:hypothetical protein